MSEITIPAGSKMEWLVVDPKLPEAISGRPCFRTGHRVELPMGGGTLVEVAVEARTGALLLQTAWEKWLVREYCLTGRTPGRI